MKKKLNCIMLIDDNPDDNFYHQIILEDLELAEKIIIQETAVKALEFFKKQETKTDDEKMTPDLIFLDINMPGMNGFEFLEEYNNYYREKNRTSVIMMLTTSSAVEEKRKAKEFGIKHFFSKPLNKEEVKQILSKA